MSFIKELTVDSRTDPLIDFASAPPLGFKLHIQWFRRGETQTCTLEKVEKHVRRYDGVETSVLHWRDERGTEYTSGLKCRNLQKVRPPLIDFTTPPPIGYRLTQKPNGEALARPLTLVAATPYTRKTDKVASYVLTWQDEQGGRYRSGMRGPYPRPLWEHEDL